ncbi:MAG: polysaccharide biosynthesis C-terminal domain-containing protein [Flavobacteriales bacterium]|nr:polysaccharide biosynthesis C-terminal domain-containing protein [Flavobacteriales bacterium]MCX7768847.1 polysaccharide biosynthesis C-terminal domain-containing protein [Flavobacteriales bacterium]MDW8410517.1 polysaccharide biosynthesis C-terminal domain-containing protein [Flavobacteriales bacterium]
MAFRIKQLASQTAIYGLSNIVPRLLNYLLTPLLTGIFEPSVYAIVNELYSYIAITLAVLTFGLETALLRFSQLESDERQVFGTAFCMVAVLTGLFFIAVVAGADTISHWLRYPGHSDYVIMFSLIIALDALSALPQTRLRQLNKAGHFAFINLVNVGVSVMLILFWLVYCRQVYLAEGRDAHFLVKYLYNHDYGVAYVFISNIVASGVRLLMLLPVLGSSLGRPSLALGRRMLAYSWPLAVGSVCFIINEKADILFLTHTLPREEARHAVGVYAACYKLALLMYLFIQAFRFAAEPYFFAQLGKKDEKEIYATVMEWFVGFCLGIFLFINLFIDLLKYFITQEVYWEGLGIVPIISMAILLSGIYLILSMWYKLSGHTQYGMYFSLLGAFVTVTGNVVLIPLVGYWGSAWATLACYLTMTAVSYFFGSRIYKISFNLRKLGILTGIAAAFYAMFLWIIPENSYMRWGIASLLLFLYFYLAYGIVGRKPFLYGMYRKN